MHGALILMIAHVPFIAEVAYELILNNHITKLIPPNDRRFFRISHYVFMRNLTDSREIMNLKRKFRQSIYRKISFGLFGFSVFVILLFKGWNPFI